jgi:hypothetical protein
MHWFWQTTGWATFWAIVSQTHLVAVARSHSYDPMLQLHNVKSLPRANLTITSSNASAVKNYNATCSQVRFENKNIFFYFDKNALAYFIQRWRSMQS